ncbi:MAG TPA: DinB family protein [Terriglobales bacterium]|nr:DinB family protein [Terriglobales bacterium]
MLKFIQAAALVSLVSVAMSAQQSSGSAKVKPAPSPSKAVLDSWNDIGRKLIAMAEDFSEDKYDYKPNPTQRSFAEQLLHAAGSNYYFTNIATGQKPPTEDYPHRDQYKTKADIVGFVKKSFDDGAAVIKKMGDGGMSKIVTDTSSNQQVRVSDLAYGLIEHSGEHYGQLVVYYRTAGLVPPESRPKK